MPSVQHRLLYPRRPGRPRKDPFDRRGHHARPELDVDVPLLVTQKFREGLPDARTTAHMLAFRDVLVRKQDPREARVVEFSLQGDHYHMIVEAPGGREGLSTTLRRLHRALTAEWNAIWVRSGGVFASYDEVPLNCARQASHATAYVLWNAYKHKRRGLAPDPASSARWSHAWTTRYDGDSTLLQPVFTPTTKILREAHRRFPVDTRIPPRRLRAA